MGSSEIKAGLSGEEKPSVKFKSYLGEPKFKKVFSPLYKNPETNVFLEIKEANNPYKTYNSNCVGKKANVTVKFQKYTITSYLEVQSNPMVPAVQIYSSGTGEISSQFAINDMLGHNHLTAVDGGIVKLYE